ncbi:MAG TPA: Wzz/FepE/Etk N-terminal domain-containing protein [Steroidobacteraceae bacterium]|nr:Wzz/FepE/Etk N-terminal domain-containing protein [Steroidobacteraceae bacterium]
MVSEATGAVAGNVDGISLLDMVRMVRKHLLGCVVVGLICVGAAVAYALLATPKYRAEIVVREAERSGLGAAQSISGQLGGLASLAGLNLAALGDNRDALPMLRSRMLVEEFLRRHQLEKEILHGSGDKVSLWRAVLTFQKSVAMITEDKRKGTTTLAITWRDADEAAKWANGLVDLANELLRARDKDRAERSLVFLNKQLVQTDVVEVRRAIFALIENEMKTLMLTDAHRDYALVVIDPAVAPELRYSPRRTLIAIIGAVLGAVCAVAYAIGVTLWPRLRAALLS